MPAAELKPGLLKHKPAKNKEEIAPEEQLVSENYDHMQILQEVCNVLQVVEEFIYLLFLLFPKKKIQ